jgi:hypothetical protein
LESPDEAYPLVAGRVEPMLRLSFVKNTLARERINQGGVADRSLVVPRLMVSRLDLTHVTVQI